VTPARIDCLLAASLAAATVAVGACGSSSKAADPHLPSAIGKGEGALNLIAWEGYAQPEWTRPFEAKTGCKLHVTYAGSSDEMVALMRQGGGSTYDMVSASGDASLRLIQGGNVQPMNVALVPEWKNFILALKSPPHNTVKGVHYGISTQWGPNVLLYDTRAVPAPKSWEVIYSPRYRGRITIPDNPIQIADAALYLSRHEPSLGIGDPYELTEAQLDAAIKLLSDQRPLLARYWHSATEEIEMFKRGEAVVGAAWPYQYNKLREAGYPVAETIPEEGATGWADTWMLAAHARHPNCAYEWVNWVSSPKVQAEQAISFGETPANTRACAEMERIKAGSCTQYHANAPAAYFNSISFWRTPVTECGNGKDDCMPYSAWEQKWTEATGG
jgi:putative spermidine/putrescine transport system substrate-binding protein